jgi:hypothetical protein
MLYRPGGAELPAYKVKVAAASHAAAQLAFGGPTVTVPVTPLGGFSTLIETLPL